MPLALYMDQNAPRAITLGLRVRGIDVLSAHEDGASTFSDPALMDRAGELGRLLFTRDDDLLAEAARRQKAGIPFSEVVFAHQLRVTIGKSIEDLDLIAKAADPADMASQVLFLPI